MKPDDNALSFVTLRGLLAYGEWLVARSPSDGVTLPSPPPPTADRITRATEAMRAIRAFVEQAKKGFPDVL
jgi:hypothetical protein